jgi:predicted amidohydrolase
MTQERAMHSRSKVSVAAVNYEGIWGDKAANLDKIKAHVREAAAVGVDIVCFPELALSGYECDEVHEDGSPCSMHVETAETIPGPATDELARLCRELDIYVIVGMPERDAADEERRYISAAVVGPEGLVGAHRKTCVIGPPLYTEPRCFEGGDEVPVFQTAHGTIGVLICYEFSLVPELARIQYLKGARILFNLNASPVGGGKPQFLTRQTAARATENLIYSVTSNRVGREASREYYGHSTIAGPAYPRLNRILAQGGEREELVYATVDLAALDAWSERNFDPAGNVDWELVAREYAQLSDRLRRPVAVR